MPAPCFAVSGFELPFQFLPKSLSRQTERHPCKPVMGNFYGFNRDAALSRIERRPGIFDRQTAAKIPDVVRHLTVIEQHDHAIAATASPGRKTIMPVPQRRARAHALLER